MLIGIFLEGRLRKVQRRHDLQLEILGIDQIEVACRAVTVRDDDGFLELDVSNFTKLIAGTRTIDQCRVTLPGA